MITAHVCSMFTGPDETKGSLCSREGTIIMPKFVCPHEETEAQKAEMIYLGCRACNGVESPSGENFFFFNLTKLLWNNFKFSESGNSESSCLSFFQCSLMLTLYTATVHCSQLRH